MVRLNAAIVLVALSASTVLALPNTVLFKRQSISDGDIPQLCQGICQPFTNLQNDRTCTIDFDCICAARTLGVFHNCAFCINLNTPEVFPDGVDAADQAYKDSCSTGDLSLLSTTVESSSASTSANVVSSSSAALASSTTKASSTGSSTDLKTSTVSGGDIPTPTSSGPTNSQTPNGGEALTQNRIHYAAFGAIVLGAMAIL